jgi:rubrerythrin
MVMGYVKWSSEKIVEFLRDNNRPLELLSDFTKSKDPCTWKCNKCGYIWKSLLHNILGAE